LSPAAEGGSFLLAEDIWERVVGGKQRGGRVTKIGKTREEEESGEREREGGREGKREGRR